MFDNTKQVIKNIGSDAVNLAKHSVVSLPKALFTDVRQYCTVLKCANEMLANDNTATDATDTQ